MNQIVSQRAQPVKNSYSLRIFLLLLGVIAFVLIIMVRLFFLQISHHGYYEILAASQHDATRVIDPKRGSIYLTPISGKGEPLLAAATISKPLVYAVPKQITDVSNVASKLAPFLEMKSKDLQDKIIKGNQNYTVLKKQLTEEIAQQIKDMDISGIRIENETVRFYPEKTLASQVLGFLGFKNDERVGQYGVEGQYEDKLAGFKGLMGIEKDPAGRWIASTSRDYQEARNGDDIYLTLDPAIQFEAQSVLAATVKTHGADSGSIVIINPRDGAVLAMANYPEYDPNEYGKVTDASIYSNRALAADYEPGSIFKPITMSAALNENAVTPETTYEDTGAVKMEEYTIKNSDNKANGVQTMTQVLEKSLNTGIVFAEQKLGNDKFREYVKRFGFGKIVDFDLNGQAEGNITNVNKKSDIYHATAAFGQGITVTPLQMVTAFSAIANEGKTITPYIIKKIVSPDGAVLETYPKPGKEVISSKTAAVLSAMLVNVVENGHGKRAGVKGYFIAGKTGTAQVPYKDRPGYNPDLNIGSFIGFGPVDNPQFLMLVRIDNPRDVKFAESTAAPAFGEIATFILNYLQVPSSRTDQ
jgi:cell division protein FtsI/penicillin-binding protein 2